MNTKKTFLVEIEFDSQTRFRHTNDFFLAKWMESILESRVKVVTEGPIPNVTVAPIFLTTFSDPLLDNCFRNLSEAETEHLQENE